MENNFDWLTPPVSTAAELIPTFVWAQEESPFWSFSRKSLLEEFERADWEQGFEIHDSGVILRGKITQQGYLYDTDIGFAIPQEGAKETYFAFAFSVELEE